MDPLSYWDSQVPPLIRQTFQQSKWQAEIERQIEAEQRLSVLDDDWRDILYSALYTEYESPRVRATLKRLITTEHNLAKRICQELSRVYKWGATRELESPQLTETHKKLAEESRLDERLGRANFLVNGLRDIGLAPRVTKRGRMAIDIYLPDRTVVMQDPDDPTDAIAQWSETTLLHTPGYDLIQRVWVDAEEWRYYDQHGKLQGTKPHRVGRLPVLWVHADERIDEFWSSTVGRDLFEANLSVGKDLFKLSRMLHFQSELQPTYQGKAQEIARGTTIGGDSVWAGQGAWGVLNLQGDPNHLIATIRARIGWIAEQYGLAADVYDLSAAATSGFQIRLKRLPLEEARAAQIKLWRRVERELLTLMAHASQEHPFYKLPLDVEYTTLNFHEEPMLEDPLNQNRVWKERIELGVQSRVDVKREIDPDLSKEQAKAKLRETTNENEAWIAMQKRMGAPKDPADGPGRDPRETGAEGGRKTAAMRAVVAKALNGGGDGSDE